MREKAIKLIIDFPFIFFAFAFILVVFFDFYFFATPNWSQLISVLTSILITLIYFTGIIFYGNKKKRIIYKVSMLTKDRILNYIIFQFKVVFLEDILLRYIPLIIAIFLLNNHFLISFILTLIFTIIHFYKYSVISVLVFAEFFLFFFISSIFFMEYKSFLILFFPHFLRNLILEFIRG